jgi:predicted NBD/HSP70 family sugar kinase
MTLGLDLSDGPARAVVVNEQAQVLARGEHPIASGGAAAAAAAIRQAASGAGGPILRSAVALPHHGGALPAELEQVCRELLPKAPAPALVAAGVAAAVAEQWCGAARGLSTLVALTAGEHVTSGIILDGRVWAGAHDLAGSVGWLSLNPVDREDYRRLGGLEADVSSGGIVRRVVWRIKSGDHSAIVAQHEGDLARITVDQVFQGARTGDGLCVSVVRDTAKYIGMAASNVAAILDPQAIVLGGVLATFGDLLLEPIRLECTRRLSPAQAGRLRVALSPLGPDAVAIGAAQLAHTPS